MSHDQDVDDVPPIDALRNAWRDLAPEQPTDATTFIAINRLRQAWHSLPIPPLRPPFIAKRRFGARYAVAAAFLCALTLGFLQVDPRPERRAASPPTTSLALELARLTTWNSATALLIPCFFCLGCELLMSPSPDALHPLPPNEPDHRLADALRADCRGDWSGAVVILEPLLESTTLTPDQRTRATVALARAYQQLGHSDQALALADVRAPFPR